MSIEKERLVFNVSKCFIAFLFAFLVGAAQAKTSYQDFEQNGQYMDINYNEEATNLIYGAYEEVEFFLKGNDSNQPVEWKIDEKSLPPGLTLEQTQYNSVILYGQPVFQGKWCFQLTAKIAYSDKVAGEQVCLLSRPNEQIKYPKFQTEF